MGIALHWWRPSLARRLVAALLLAFGLVAAALLAQSYLDTRQQMASNPGIRQLGELIAASLSDLEDASQAVRVVSSTARRINDLRQQAKLLPGEVLFQLFDAQGRLVYASAASDAVRKLGVSEQTLGGRAHWTWRGDGPRWSLRLAEPVVPALTLLGWMAGELAPQMLLAFPLVLLPVLLAVYSGLSPLRRFARRIEQLDAEPAALAMNLQYAELQPLGRAFDALQERLRQRLARDRAFVQDAAHELRTPLAVIAAQTHVLTAAPDARERSEAAARLLASIRRTAHLSQQLLDLAALDADPAATIRHLDLAGLCAQLLAAQQPLARERGLQLALAAPEQLPWTLDLAAFLSVLHNLLDNALRYVPRGGRIEVCLAVRHRSLRLSVSDNGDGIAPGERELVFERFRRGSHAVRQGQPGSGLGLAIVRQAALRMGGQLTLGEGLSRDGGHGACFTLVLPEAGPSAPGPA